jgi:short-subunit dehydrogenase
LSEHAAPRGSHTRAVYAHPMPRPWNSALVTGASSGIGREIARKLGVSGTELVLVARDTERLKALAGEIAAPFLSGPQDQPGPPVEILGADLADPEQLAAVEARLADRDRPIDLLVNNAGFGTYGAFAELPIDGEQREIQVNVVAVVRLAHAALGSMRERGHGTIVNVSSVAGLQATPGNATYGASKAFVASFSEALHGEARSAGVSVTAALPGYTRTEFAERAGIEGRQIPAFAWQSAEACAAQILDAARSGKPFFVPGALNKVLVALSGPVPRGLKRRVAARLASRF